MACPELCWVLIGQHLIIIADLKYGFICGPSVIARDICNSVFLPTGLFATAVIALCMALLKVLTIMLWEAFLAKKFQSSMLLKYSLARRLRLVQSPQHQVLTKASSACLSSTLLEALSGPLGIPDLL